MLRIDRRFIKNFDWVTLSIAILIALIGIMTIYSATRPLATEEHSGFYIKQASWLILGIIALFLIVSFNYVWLSRLSLHLYITGIVLLISVFIFGKTGMGAQRWLSFGVISFQPSESFKLIYIIMLSQQLSAMDIPSFPRQYTVGRTQGLSEKQDCCFYRTRSRSSRNRISLKSVKDYSRIR